MTSTSFLLLALLQTPAPAPAPAQTTVFVNVDVLTMTDERVLEERIVVVRGDRIDSIAPMYGAVVPEDAVVVDGAGHTLLPGLADMHVHTWDEREQLAFLANGVTTVRNMFGAPQHLAWRAEIEAGERLGPTIYTAGPIVDGSPPIWPGSRVVTSFEDGIDAVMEQAEAGYAFVKAYENPTRDAYDGIVTAAEEIGIPVMGHVPRAVGIETVLAAGQVTIEHLDKYETLLSETPATSGGFDPTAGMRGWSELDLMLLPRAVEATVEAGVWNCATLIVMQKMLDADGIEAEFARPEMRYVPAATRAAWRTMSAQRLGMAESVQAGMEKRLALTRALHEGGARLVLGTDQGNPFVLPGFAVHTELANLVAAGLSPYDALRTATRNAAACMQATDEFGTVAPGLRADLLLVEGDPLEDLAALDRRVGVMARGRWLPQAELWQRLDEAMGLAPSEDD